MWRQNKKKTTQIRQQGRNCFDGYSDIRNVGTSLSNFIDTKGIDDCFVEKQMESDNGLDGEKSLKHIE